MSFVLELIAAQRLAVARAESRGLDPDHPRHLERPVILTDADRAAGAAEEGDPSI